MGAQNTKLEKTEKRNISRNAFTNYASGHSLSDISQSSSFIRSSSTNEDGSAVQPPASLQSFLATGDQLKQQQQHQNHQNTFLVALYDFAAAADGQLSIRRGQQLRPVGGGSGSDWTEVESPISRRRGWVPANYVAWPSNLHLFAWYHGPVSRRAAEYLLGSGINGSFLVRDSESEPGQLSVSVRFNGRVFHYRVNRSGDGGQLFVTAERAFASLCQLVQHHAARPDGLVCQLLYPAPKRLRAPAACQQAAGSTEDAWEVERTELVMQQKLGAGQYGDVYQAVWKRWGNLTVAVKTVKEDMATKVKDFLIEAHVMKQLRHENLLQLLGVCSREPPCYIITEFMPHGSLLEFLQARRGQLAPFALLYMATQIASGMAHMERSRFVHRDLAARNCLVGEGFVVKVADFGLTRRLHGEDPYMARQGAKFPIKWTAPEGLAYNRFTSRSDVWSFGVLLWEIATYGCSPYPGVELTEVYRLLEHGVRMERPADCPDSVYQLMHSCWLWQPELRPPFTDLHARFKAVCNDFCAAADASEVASPGQAAAATPLQPPQLPRASAGHRSNGTASFCGWSTASVRDDSLPQPSFCSESPPLPPPPGRHHRTRGGSPAGSSESNTSSRESLTSSRGPAVGVKHQQQNQRSGRPEQPADPNLLVVRLPPPVPQ